MARWARAFLVRPSYPSGLGPPLARRLFPRHSLDGGDHVFQFRDLAEGAAGRHSVVLGLWPRHAGRIRVEGNHKSCPLLLWVSLPARRRRLGRHAYVCR